jgi:hypothetical protein
MKKAKLMLMGIAILAAVGGVLAFRSHNAIAYGGPWRCTPVFDPLRPTYCPLTSYTTGTIPMYCTTIPGATCILTSVKWMQ